MGESATKSTLSQAQRDWIDTVIGARARPAEDQASGGPGKVPPSTDTDLFFAKDSSTLTKGTRDALDRFAQADTAAHGSAPITIDAWASTEGDKGHNEKLAAARAKAVADYLAGQGIAKDRLKPAGQGATAKFSKDDPAQNRRATLPAAPKPAAAPAGTPKPPAAPTTLKMRDPIAPKDTLGVGEATEKVVGTSTEVPRDQVQRLLEDWLKRLSANQPNAKGKVRATDNVAEAERRLRLGLPGSGVLTRGDDTDYDPAGLAAKIAQGLPPTIPAANVAEFRKMSDRDTPKEKTLSEHAHDKYVAARDEFIKKFPEKLQGAVKKGLDAAVEKGVPFVLDAAAGAAEVPGKLKDEAKTFIEKWTKTMTGNEDAEQK